MYSAIFTYCNEVGSFGVKPVQSIFSGREDPRLRLSGECLQIIVRGICRMHVIDEQPISAVLPLICLSVIIGELQRRPTENLAYALRTRAPEMSPHRHQ